MIPIGERIKASRRKAKLTQEDLGKQLGKTLRTIQKYESGEIEPSISLVFDIARVLNVAPEYLFGCQRADLSHIMLIEAEEALGPYQAPRVILFNKTQVSEEDALRIVNSGEHCDNVLMIPRSQWMSLFLDQQRSK